jgi:hypothetical protein
VDNSSICANDGCTNVFQKKTHNQKYCSNMCCRKATNRKIMERYYEDKELRSGNPRNCSSCSVKLSKYNLGKICAACEAEDVKNSKNMLIEQIAVIEWG